MRKVAIYLFIMSLGVVGNALAQQDFYYAYQEKIAIRPSDSKAVVRMLQPTQDINSLLVAHKLNVNNYKIARLDPATFQIETQNGGKIQDLILVLSSDVNIHTIQPFFYTNDGGELGVTDEIVAEFNEQVSLQQREQLLNTLNVHVKEDKKFYVILSVPKLKNAIEIANQLQQSGLVIYAHPNFLVEMQKTMHYPNDPFFNMQYNLHNTGQVFNDGHTGTPDADVDAPEVWDVTKGSPTVIIAVIDEGVTSNHPDLPNSRQLRLPGSNFASRLDGTDPNDPSPVGNGNHGNACAGIIAATQDNNEGITGIAPHCTIMPIRIPFGSVPSEVYANAINFAWRNGAHILSNSWNFSSSNPDLFPVIRAAILNAATRGRGGLGSVVVFSASNSADQINGNRGMVSFPANITIPQVITVGASDRYDRQANYSPSSNLGSPFNQMIDVVAPSHRAYSGHPRIPGENFEIWSIDIPGTAGYNSAMGMLPTAGTNFLSYTGRMGGTSAAAPMVAGIAGLILSVNNSITSQEVLNIITCSAQDVGGYSYSSGRSDEMGHGRVNAFNAVMSACPHNYTINWIIPNRSVIQYQARAYIVANNVIENGSNVIVKTNEEIIFNPGFVAQSGSNLHAYLEWCDCDNVSSTGARIAINETTTVPELSVDADNSVAERSFNADVFPNPSTGKFIVRVRNSETIEAEVIVLDVFGRKVKDVFSGQIAEGEFEVLMDADTPGMYFVNIRTPLSTIVKKVIIK